MFHRSLSRHKNLQNTTKQHKNNPENKIRKVPHIHDTIIIAKVLIDVDDWQDTWNTITRTKNNNSIKNIVKTAAQTFLGCMLNGILIGIYLEEKTDIILADEIIPYIAQTIFGDNARIFTKIIYPLIDTAIQIIGNGGPTMYLIGTILGNTWTQLLQQAVNW